MSGRQRFLDGWHSFQAANFAPKVGGSAQKLLVFCSTGFKGVTSNYAHPILSAPDPVTRYNSAVYRKTYARSKNRRERGTGTDRCQALQTGCRSNRPDDYLLLP